MSDNNSKKKIVIISHSIAKNKDGVDSNDYYASLVFLLTKRIQVTFNDTIDVVLKIPNDHSQQLQLIKNAADDKEVVFIVVSPENVDLYYKVLAELIVPLVIKKRIVFVDQGFEYRTAEQNKILLKDHLPLPPYVQADWSQGGEKAGESAYLYLTKHEISTPHIVLFEGGVGSAPRIAGFREFLKRKSAALGTIFYPTFIEHDAKYLKSKSLDFFTKYLKESIKSKNPIDIVFCTNDEMALGAREALIANPDFLKVENEHFRKGNSVPKIIGFDGILDITLLLSANHEDFIYDTILVGLEEQITATVNIIENQLKNIDLPDDERLCVVKCESYREKHKFDNLSK